MLSSKEKNDQLMNIFIVLAYSHLEKLLETLLYIHINGTPPPPLQMANMCLPQMRHEWVDAKDIAITSQVPIPRVMNTRMM
jgi:hypothetical protein